MEAARSRRTQNHRRETAQLDWSVVWPWLLGFGLVAYLGLGGGGYDPLVHDQVGIAAWWVLLATVAVGAIPRRGWGPSPGGPSACSSASPPGPRSA